MSKVFADQKAQFESQEVFRRLNRKTEVVLSFPCLKKFKIRLNVLTTAI